MKTIVVTGIGDTRNNGCWGMVASAIANIREASPVPVKFIILNRKNAIDRQRLSFEEVEFVSRPWSLVSISGVRLLWLFLCATLLVIQGCLYRVMPNKIIFRDYWRAIDRADLILDLSGDSISSDYGWVANLTVVLPLLIARLIGKPFYLCAQSIGPFGKKWIDHLTIDLLKSAQLITVREGLTMEILSAFGIINNVRRTQDLTFVLPLSGTEECQCLADLEGIDLSREWVGVSVSSIIARYAFHDLTSAACEEAYIDAMATFCDELHERYGFSILFVPHVVIPGQSNDRRITVMVQKKMRYKETSWVIKGDYTGAQLKSLIGLCRFFVGSRMHATIAALSQGIPTLTLVYNHKTIGINGDVLGMHNYLIDVRRTTSKVFGKTLMLCFAQLVENADFLRSTLLSILPRICEEARANAWFAVDFLDVAGPLQEMQNPWHCSGCGTCAAVCPEKALVMGETPEGTLRPGLRRKCKKCRLCDGVCPSLGFNLCSAVRERFPNARFDDELGVCIACRTGYARDKDVRFNGSSGGLATAVGMHLLASNRVDAVLVVSADIENPFVQRGFWAVNEEELREAQGSRYLPAAVNDAYAKIPAEAKRLAVIGLPCHLWGLHLLEKSGFLGERSVDWRLGLFCGRTPSLHAIDTLLTGLNTNRGETTAIFFRGEGWPGTSRIHTTKKVFRMPLSEMWGFIGSPFFNTPHCFSCPDFFSLLSDLSFGDAWLHECRGDKEGTNLVLARTERGASLLDEMTHEKLITSHDVSFLRVREAFRANILRKQRYSVIKEKVTGEAFPVKYGIPHGGSIRVYLSYRYEWFLAKLGMLPKFRRTLPRYPPTRIMRILKRISVFLQKGR